MTEVQPELPAMNHAPKVSRGQGKRKSNSAPHHYANAIMSVQSSAEGGLPGPCYGATAPAATAPAAVVGGKMFRTAEVASQVAASLLVAPTFNPSTTRRQPMNPSANSHTQAARPGQTNFTPQPTSQYSTVAVPSPTKTELVGRRILVAKPSEAPVEPAASRTLKTSTTSNGIVIVTATHFVPPPHYSSLVGVDSTSAMAKDQLPTVASSYAAPPSTLARHRSRCAAPEGTSPVSPDVGSPVVTGGRRRILPSNATITTTASAFQPYGRSHHQDPHTGPFSYPSKSTLNLSSETESSAFTNVSSEPTGQQRVQQYGPPHVKSHHDLSSVNISTATTVDDTDRRQQNESIHVVVDDGQLDVPLDASDVGHIQSAPRRIVSVKSSPKKPSNSSIVANSADLDQEVSPAPTAILATHNNTDNGSSRSASTGVSGKSDGPKESAKPPAIALASYEAPYRSSSPPPPPLRTGSPIDVLAAAGAIKIFRTPSPLPKESEGGPREGTRSPLPGSPTTESEVATTSFTYRYAHNPYGNHSPIGNGHSNSFRGLSPTLINRPTAITSTAATNAANANTSFGNSPCQVASSMDEMYHGSAFAQHSEGSGYPTLTHVSHQPSEAAPSSSPIGPKPPLAAYQQQTIFGEPTSPIDQPTTKVISTAGRLFQFSAPPPLPPPSTVSPIAATIKQAVDESDRPRAVSPTGGANGAHNPYFRPPPPMTTLLTSPTTNSAASAAAIATPTYATTISPYQWIEAEEDQFAASLTDYHPATVQPKPTAVTARRIVPPVANPSVQQAPTPSGRRIVSGVSVASVQRPPSLFTNSTAHQGGHGGVAAVAPSLTSPYTTTPTGRRYHNGRPVAVAGGVVPSDPNVVVTKMSY